MAMALKRFVRSVGLLYLHFVHVALLQLMGPRCAIWFTRCMSFVWWLLTFLGVNKTLRRTLDQVLPQIRPDLRTSTVLRRYLANQHQHFVEWNTYPTARGRRFAERISQEIEGREHLDGAIRNGRGVILSLSHFGMTRMYLPALASSGYASSLYALRAERYPRECFDFVARAVVNKKSRAEVACGHNVIYHRRGGTFKVIADQLRRNSIVALAGDGVAGTKFVDVPFLNGIMSFPTGLARLAAETGAAIVCMFCVLEGPIRHRFVVHPPISCCDSSPASIETAVRTYVAFLEEYVRRYPWAWWIWRRIEVERGGRDGMITRYIIKDLPTEETRYYTPEKR